MALVLAFMTEMVPAEKLMVTASSMASSPAWLATNCPEIGSVVAPYWVMRGLRLVMSALSAAGRFAAIPCITDRLGEAKICAGSVPPAALATITFVNGLIL